LYGFVLYRRGGGSDKAICAVAGTATQSNVRRITKGIVSDTIVLGNAVGSRVLVCLVKEEMDKGFGRDLFQVRLRKLVQLI